MLTVHQLSHAFNLKTLFEGVTFSINPGDRIGLVGANGCGKTTLLRRVAGELPAEDVSTGAGHITTAGDARLGYLPQGFRLDPEQSLDAVIGRAAGDIDALEAELAAIAGALAQTPDDPALTRQYDRLLDRLGRADPGRTQAVLAALGLDGLDGAQPVGRLSGGQKTRLTLALLLLDAPDILLLDEPTNHLDIGAIEWLEDWLAGFDGGVLLVSHDRTFLDRTCNRILAFDPTEPTIRAYAGNYSDYLDHYLAEREKQWAAYKDQVAEIRRMRQDIQRQRERADRIQATTTSRQPGLRKKGKKAMQRATARESKLERYLEDDERVEKPARTWQMKLDFDDAIRTGRQVLVLDGAAVGYTPGAPLLSDLTLTIRGGERVVLTGANGAGKTTLLRTVVGRLSPLAGVCRLGASVRLGYMSQEQTLLDPDANPVSTIQAVVARNETDVRNFLHFFLFKDDEALKPNRQLSFGQRARLSLARLVAQGCNFLVLDEPINHLDIPSRTQFEQALLQFDGATLAVAHDRYFIDRFATTVWWAEAGTIRVESRQPLAL